MQLRRTSHFKQLMPGSRQLRSHIGRRAMGSTLRRQQTNAICCQIVGRGTMSFKCPSAAFCRTEPEVSEKYDDRYPLLVEGEMCTYGHFCECPCQLRHR